jgi:hypothetical protein
MHGPIKFKSPNNISEWQMGFNSTFKWLISKAEVLILMKYMYETSTQILLNLHSTNLFLSNWCALLADLSDRRHGSFLPTQSVLWQWPCNTYRELQVPRYTNINTAKVSNHNHMRQTELATSCPCKVRKFWSLCLEACMFEWQCGNWDLSQPGRRYF